MLGPSHLHRRVPPDGDKELGNRQLTTQAKATGNDSPGCSLDGRFRSPERVTGANTEIAMNDEQLALACGLALGVLMALFI